MLLTGICFDVIVSADHECRWYMSGKGIGTVLFSVEMVLYLFSEVEGGKSVGAAVLRVEAGTTVSS